jgi:hypothetical protein
MKIAFEYMPNVPGESEIYYSTNDNAIMFGVADATLTWSGGTWLSIEGTEIVPWVKSNNQEPETQQEIRNELDKLNRDIDNNEREILNLQKKLELRKKRDEEVLFAKAIIYKCLIEQPKEEAIPDCNCVHKPKMMYVKTK